MKATGIIVEYNPFHNGHLYHINESKRTTNADCIVAIMSGPFLQRGEPAIIDKFTRTETALKNGADIVIELPFSFAVQSSKYFAQGAIDTLKNLFVDTICFGSEIGKIEPFIEAAQNRITNKIVYNQLLKEQLDSGVSYPSAHTHALEALNMINDSLDLRLPNNILGFSYTNHILKTRAPIDITTIKRINADYHEQEIKSSIASATSIRKVLLNTEKISLSTKASFPEDTFHQLADYKSKTGMWHTLESYFPYLHTIVLRASLDNLRSIHGMDEGLEYKLKETVQQANSIDHWIQLMKSKRYTWTRIQRLFIHLLTNSTKEEIKTAHESSVTSIRLLGMTTTGQKYLNLHKKQMSLPIVTNYRKNQDLITQLNERASLLYYEPLSIAAKRERFKLELTGPIRM